MILCFITDLTYVASCLLPDKPGPVQDLKVKEITANTVTLRWSPPVHDGGRDITGYIVEKREGNRRMWQNMTTTEATEFEVPGLFEGNQYNFRVSAENSVGTGEPVEIKDLISPKNQFCKQNCSMI